MAKIGILGGTFDPIHNGHIELAKAAYKQYSLDKIWFMVSPTPPHKANKYITNIIHRCEMINLAIKEYDYMEFSDFELSREGYVYTAETLTLLEKEYPNDEFFFIIGADSLNNIDRWYKPEVVLSKCILLAASRSGNTDIDNLIKEKSKKYNADIRKIDFDNIDISSTELRDITDEDELETMVCKDVAKYICANNLYGFEKEYEHMYFRNLRKEIRKNMTKKRHEHSIGVEFTATCLAMRYDVNLINKARIAGILHDCAKCMDDKDVIELCKKHNIPVNKYENEHPFMLHGKTGAHLAKVEYGIEDIDILDAITYHTVGRPNMTLLEKIIFTADYIEPGRDQAPNLEYLRNLAFTDLDEAVYRIVTDTIQYLKDYNEPINEVIFDVYDFYKNLYESR